MWEPVPLRLALLVLFFVPESERWKAAVKKGGRSPVVEIFGPGLLKKTLLAMAFSAIPLIGTWAAVSIGLPTWADQIQEAQAGKTLLPEASRAAFEAAGTPKQRTTLLQAHSARSSGPKFEERVPMPGPWSRSSFPSGQSSAASPPRRSAESTAAGRSISCFASCPCFPAPTCSAA